MHSPPHIPKTSETVYITHALHYKKPVVYAMYQMSKFSNFFAYFTKLKAIIFSLKHKDKLQHMIENSIKTIQHLTFFSDVTRG